LHRRYREIYRRHRDL
jgi:hypothetical protein